MVARESMLLADVADEGTFLIDSISDRVRGNLRLIEFFAALRREDGLRVRKRTPWRATR